MKKNFDIEIFQYVFSQNIFHALPLALLGIESYRLLRLITISNAFLGLKRLLFIFLIVMVFQSNISCALTPIERIKVNKKVKDVDVSRFIKRKAKIVRFDSEGNIIELSFIGGNIEKLPEGIGNLNRLQKLNLSNNRLTIIPPEIGNLKELRELYLSSNRLTAIPKEIGNLKELDRLWLDDNELSMLPDEIGGLTRLKWLDLEYNRLTTLPAKTGNLKGLNKLWLRGNDFNTLPASLKGLTALQELGLNLQRKEFESVERFFNRCFDFTWEGD